MLRKHPIQILRLSIPMIDFFTALTFWYNMYELIGSEHLWWTTYKISSTRKYIIPKHLLHLGYWSFLHKSKSKHLFSNFLFLISNAEVSNRIIICKSTIERPHKIFEIFIHIISLAAETSLINVFQSIARHPLPIPFYAISFAKFICPAFYQTGDRMDQGRKDCCRI